MTYRYTAHLAPELNKRCFAETVEIPSIADAQDGFWINKHGTFTRDDDCILWVPPSQILFVKKEVG